MTNYIERLDKDLENEIKDIQQDYKENGCNFDGDIDFIARHFANWQKEQMMKEAVETTISSMVHQLIVTDYIIVNAEQFDLKRGDKVKVLIIKEE